MITQVILESENGKLISYERIDPALTYNQVHRTLSQHYFIFSLDVDDGIAKVVLGRLTRETAGRITEMCLAIDEGNFISARQQIASLAELLGDDDEELVRARKLIAFLRA